MATRKKSSKSRTGSLAKRIEKAVIAEIKNLLAKKRPARKPAKKAARKATKGTGKTSKKSTKKLVKKAARKVVKKTARRIAKNKRVAKKAGR